MREKEKKTKERDEKQFKKERKIGMVCMGIAVLFIIFQIIYNAFLSKEEKKPTANATPTQNVRVVQSEAVTSAALSAVGETTTAENDEHDQKSNIKLKALNKEVLTLLNINKKKLKETITEFAKDYGYEYAESAIYYGQTVIDHSKNTVTCSFALDNGEEEIADTLKFDLIYSRDNKSYWCVMW